MSTYTYHPTGNDFLSLPTLIGGNGGIERLNFLSMRHKGLLEFRGVDDRRPLLLPVLSTNGQAVPFQSLAWNRRQYWIPGFSMEGSGLTVKGLIYAPMGERGFIYRLSITAPDHAARSVYAGFDFCWEQLSSRIYASKTLRGVKTALRQTWLHGLAAEFSADAPVCALAMSADVPEELQLSIAGAASAPDAEMLSAHAGVHIGDIPAGQTRTVNFCFGIGQEEFSAATTVIEMKRRTPARLLEETLRWLEARTVATGDPRLDDIANKNYFFNHLYATGTTLDTEETVLVTSRSHRYYVSAAYWDRDSLLWSFPAILARDPPHARRMLEYAFIRQIRNAGTHCRYLDGSVLEPGFELDELCAPVIALKRYYDVTRDAAFVRQPFVLGAIERILETLNTRKHPEEALYETTSSPSDDFCELPYLAYDNVLTCRMLKDCAALFRLVKRPGQGRACAAQARQIKQAILTHLVKAGPTGKMFAWSTDLKGNHAYFDEPPGSLKLLPHYGFCSADDPVYRNTLAWLHSKHNPYSFHDRPFSEVGCAHAKHPWTLGLCNSLLSGRGKEAVDILHRTALDNGFACESFDENTGAPTSGEAFATCAGFLAYALGEYLAKPAVQ
jgi:hypothetical protein